MSIFYDVLAMGLALAIAIGLFALLFVVPFVAVWFVARGVGGAWRWALAAMSGAFPLRGHVPRHRHP